MKALDTDDEQDADEDDNDEERICPLCNEPIEPGEKTDEGEYGTVHHNCPDFLDDPTGFSK